MRRAAEQQLLLLREAGMNTTLRDALEVTLSDVAAEVPIGTINKIKVKYQSQI